MINVRGIYSSTLYVDEYYTSFTIYKDTGEGSENVIWDIISLFNVYKDAPIYENE